ncbi:MAG: AmmeMemoRadiSam system radical SAM enzyme [Kiritimatiellia bacterium]
MREGQQGFCFVRLRRREDRAHHLTVLQRLLHRSHREEAVEPPPPRHPGALLRHRRLQPGRKFCQNHDISKSRETDTLADAASPPTRSPRAAVSLGCRSVAFTYNDPVIFLEYAIDTAIACRARGLRTVAVTAGYMKPAPRAEFYEHMDAANIDLKGFTESFYDKVCASHLRDVLDTLVWVRQHRKTWLEITTLLIPGLNDSDEELAAAADWFATNLGPDVPWHFTAFHPDWKMLDLPATSAETLSRARRIAMERGLNHVYTGNVHDPKGGSTWCPACGACVIGRDWYSITGWDLDASGRCGRCGTAIPGVFEACPGTWGPRREPVRIR